MQPAALVLGLACTAWCRCYWQYARQLLRLTPRCGLVVCRYKDFLDSVTPAEWFVAQAEKQEQRRQDKIAAWRAECEVLKQKREAAAAAKARWDWSASWQQLISHMHSLRALEPPTVMQLSYQAGLSVVCLYGCARALTECAACLLLPAGLRRSTAMQPHSKKPSALKRQSRLQ